MASLVSNKIFSFGHKLRAGTVPYVLFSAKFSFSCNLDARQLLEVPHVLLKSAKFVILKASLDNIIIGHITTPANLHDG